MSLFRPTANKEVSKLCCLVAVCLGTLGLSATSALASKSDPGVKASSAKVNAELAVCPGQTFSQPFEAFQDSNYYTLVEGSEFDEGAQGWELNNGAEVVDGTRPDGSSGGVLNLPSGAYAVSPPVCVTLQYPTARTWVQSVAGDGSVSVGVYYAAAKSGAGSAKQVARLKAETEDGWGLSNPFDVRPQLGGKAEGIREVRFILANTEKSSVLQVSGLFVDPRMR
jgi:hypothetical protein